MILNVYLSRLTAVNSYYFMQDFDGLYDNMLNSLLLLLYSYGDVESLYYYGQYFLRQLSIFTSVIGFVIVFVALLYSTFGYIRQRSLFGTATFMVSNCMWSVIGYMLASGIVWDIFYASDQSVVHILEPVLKIIARLLNIRSLVN